MSPHAILCGVLLLTAAVLSPPSPASAAGPLWVKHNAAGGEYYVQVIPRSDRMLSRTTVDVPDEPDVWHQVELVFIVPPDSRTVGLYLFTERREPGAQVFVDDFFIGRYPTEG